MSETKKEYIKKEIMASIKEHGVMIGVNGSPATLTKKDDHFFIHIDRNLLFSGSEEETLNFLNVTFTA